MSSFKLIPPVGMSDLLGTGVCKPNLPIPSTAHHEEKPPLMDNFHGTQFKQDLDTGRGVGMKRSIIISDPAQYSNRVVLAEIQLKKNANINAKDWKLFMEAKRGEVAQSLNQEGVEGEHYFILEEDGKPDSILIFMEADDLQQSARIAAQSNLGVDKFHRQFKQSWDSKQKHELLGVVELGLAMEKKRRAKYFCQIVEFDIDESQLSALRRDLQDSNSFSLEEFRKGRIISAHFFLRQGGGMTRLIQIAKIEGDSKSSLGKLSPLDLTQNMNNKDLFIRSPLLATFKPFISFCASS